MSSDVPYVKLELVMGQIFDVKALSGCNCADVLSLEMKYFVRQSLENGGFTGVVQTEHQNSELLFLLLLEVSKNAYQAAALCIAHFFQITFKFL